MKAFEEQIKTTRKVTKKDINLLSKKGIEVGDKLLFFMSDNGNNSFSIESIIDRDLDLLEISYDFVKMGEADIPIFKLKV